MIETELQNNLIREELSKYEQALAALLARQASEPPYLLRRRILEDALRSIVSELGGQVEEYEALRDGRMKKLKLASLAELGHAMVLARVSTRLTHEHISGRMQWYESQFERYESDEYASVRLRQVQELLEALGIELYIEATMPNPLEGTDREQEQS